MRTTQFERWLTRRWTRAGLLYRPIEGGTPDFAPGPIQPGVPMWYFTNPLPLPQAGTKTLIAISGLQVRGGPGFVRILDVMGSVTTAIGAVANLSKLQLLGTDVLGNALTAVDLCGTVDFNGLARGTSLSITGTLASAMTTNANGVQVAMATPIHAAFGTTLYLNLNCAGSDGGAGRISWGFLCDTSYGVRVQVQFA